jgi:chemotaxis protein methyltransferase CheR
MQAVASLLIEDEGRPNALKVLSLLAESRAERSLPHELAAAAVSLLATGDRAYADQVISAFEAESSSAAAHFLRGEYHYLAEQYGEAETAFQDAAGRDRAFWPALYRLSSLAQEGNRTRYEYRIKKALESLNRGGELLYEIFIGGFSPDYYRHILENRLASCSPLESRSPAKGRTEREEG